MNNTAPCDDGNPCTLESCVPGCPNGSRPCRYVNAPEGTACGEAGTDCTNQDTCAAGGTCNPGSAISCPPETHNVVVAADKATYSWSAAAFATGYDVVRGGTGALPVGPGGGDESCFYHLGGTVLTDSSIPAPASGFWYLSRGENSCGNGTFGTQGLHGAPGAARVTATCP